jgi:anthranilate phosphoribosyltransferase
LVEYLSLALKGENFDESKVAKELLALNAEGTNIDTLLHLHSLIKSKAFYQEVPLELDAISQISIDLCGTGGDQKSTFNISSLSAFIVAGAGLKVIKHGNYSASSNCGSSNVLEALGVRFTTNPLVILKSLTENNIAYLHAPLFYPALKIFKEVRASLKVRTFFNLLGPLLNPLTPKHQIIGTPNKSILQVVSLLSSRLGINSWVLTTADGYDEVSLTDNVILKSGFLLREIMPPPDFCVKEQSLVLTGGIEEGKNFFLKLLQNEFSESGAERVVLSNAAFAIMKLGDEKPPSSFNDEAFTLAYSVAKESLRSGRAFNALTNLIRVYGA